MPLVASSLAQICKSISELVISELNHDDVEVRVTIGHPGDLTLMTTENHRLNVFFFRFEPFAFDADLLPGETLMLRTHCLMTPFALAEEGASAGENDLRLVGEVLRVFHEQPVFRLSAGGDDFHVQVIMQSLALDQLNQLWSTQGDVAYRPSVLYEISLAPVIPEEEAPGSPLIGALALGVRADLAAADGAGGPRPPEVPASTIDTTREDWAPVICFVRDGACVQSLSLATSAAGAFTPQVWVAGEAGAAVELRWDVWEGGPWRTEATATAAVALGPDLDPEQPPPTTSLVTVPLPFDDHAGQAVLYAQRDYTRGADGATITVRSNPLLVNLFEEAP